MDLLESVAILGGTVLAVGAIAAIVAAHWRELPRGPLPLYEMLRKQSDRAAGMALASGSRDFAVAVRQCLACNAKRECRSWLESDSREGFDRFCANAAYVQNMRSLAKWL